MELPPEIRNQIYSYLFVPQRVLVIRAKDDKDRHYRLYHKALPSRDPETQNMRCLPRYQSSLSRSPQAENANTANQGTMNHLAPNLTKEVKKKAKPKARRARLMANKKAKKEGNLQTMAKAGQDTKSAAEKRKNWPPQLALLFTSRQTAADITGLLYACTQFVFTSPKAIVRFLSSIPPVAKSTIKHIELTHKMYNEPSLSKYRPIKLRSDHNWFVMCEMMAELFTDLSVLHVNLTVFDTPIELEVGEGWSLPLLVFSGKGRKAEQEEGRQNGGGLRFVRVSLEYPKSPIWEVRRVERELEVRLMDPAVLQMREDEKLAREMGKPVKAKKVRKLAFH
ncbi:hypothetical protein BJX64DRAFT_287011 [Aspergillus heterothallicus]